MTTEGGKGRDSEAERREATQRDKAKGRGIESNAQARQSNQYIEQRALQQTILYEYVCLMCG